MNGYKAFFKEKKGFTNILKKIFFLKKKIKLNLKNTKMN